MEKFDYIVAWANDVLQHEYILYDCYIADSCIVYSAWTVFNSDEKVFLDHGKVTHTGGQVNFKRLKFWHKVENGV